MALGNLPSDLIRFVSRTYLCDEESLTLSRVSRLFHACCGLDVPHVLPQHILSVDGRVGFRQSRNGYRYVDPIPPIIECPSRLGALASSDPWSFVRQWLILSSPCKDIILRQHVLACMSVESSSWSSDVGMSLYVLTRKHSLNVDSILKQAAWRCRGDVLKCLLGTCSVNVDFEDGTLLRLVLCTLGHENSEDAVVDFLYDLLEAGADASRHNSWAIRLCLTYDFYVAATLLCIYTEMSRLELLLKDLQLDPVANLDDIAMLQGIMQEM